MRWIKPKRLHGNIGLIVPIAVAVLLLAGVVGLRVWYQHNLGPVSSVTTTQYFTVPSGNSVHRIAGDLEQAHLIKNAGAFETYVRRKGYSNKLQAGTYSLSPSMGVARIAKKMVDGDVAKNLLTILPGKKLDEIKQAFRKAGYSQADTDAAFNSANYSVHPALASLPHGASLEGYLYPDSFQKQADTPAQTIVRESLDEMQKHLTAKLMNGFSAQGLNTYQAITLASIIEREVSNPKDRPIVAQVFLKRLREGMKLESDATTDVYNTYENAGLPPTPVSNVTDSSMSAVASPASTDYLFFVSGDDGVTYFSHTKAEHETQVRQHCVKKCSQ